MLRKHYSTNTRSVIDLIIVAVIMWNAASATIGAEVGSDGAPQWRAAIIRDERDLSRVPLIRLSNGTDIALSIRLNAWAESPDGVVTRNNSVSCDIPARGHRDVPMLGDHDDRIAGEILLLRCSVHADGATRELAAVCGTPMPVDPETVDVFCMNAHLERYAAADQWRMCRMLRDAGVSSVRVETMLQMPDSQGNYPGVYDLDSTILAAEAFGIEPMVLIAFFPAPFYDHGEKLRLAHDWAVAMAEHYQGRVRSWSYGNETNSGWGGYGSSSDMTALNNAFALGTLSVDPHAKVASFGIAEGLPAYVRSMLEHEAGRYLNAFAVHPYCGTAEAGIAKVLGACEVIGAYGTRQDLWATEVGFHYHPGGRINPLTDQRTAVFGYSRAQQADQLVRLYTLAKSKGIQRVYWYDFFGKNDHETFWIVDENFTPTAAYHALARLTDLLKPANPIGGTPVDELIQRHYFRCGDTVTLVTWALRDGERADFVCSGDVTARDFLGNTVRIDSQGRIPLGHRPVCIEGLSAERIPSFIERRVVVSAVDHRNWNDALHRWRANAGDTIRVPFLVYNTTDHPVTCHPVILRQYPGWEIELCEPFRVQAGSTVAKSIILRIPDNAVRGVEYRFRFAAAIDEHRRSVPYECRIKVNGAFPYSDIVRRSPGGDYRSWNSFEETRVGTGRAELAARPSNAVIDGQLDEWDADEFYPLDQRLAWRLRNPGVPDEQDMAGWIALRWDQRHLYAAFLARDDDLSLLDFVSRDWRDNDNVRLFISTEPDPDKRSDTISDKELLLIAAPTGVTHTEKPVVFAASLDGFERPGFEEKVSIAARVWSGGYLVELAIPFEALKVKPQPHRRFGLNVMADDADAGYRQHVMMTCLKNFNYWISPKSLGTLILSGMSEDNGQANARQGKD